jgi:proteasome lid subunit RPN8/RPN11
VVSIPASVLDDMVAHATAEAPLECCGLLIGESRQVTASVRTTNLRQSATSYLVDPAQHFAARRRARDEGRAIVGAYHSHPCSPAVPSATDLAEAHDLGWLYVIVSLVDPAAPGVRGYRLERGRFVEVALSDRYPRRAGPAAP